MYGESGEKSSNLCTLHTNWGKQMCTYVFTYADVVLTQKAERYTSISMLHEQEGPVRDEAFWGGLWTSCRLYFRSLGRNSSCLLNRTIHNKRNTCKCTRYSSPSHL